MVRVQTGPEHRPDPATNGNGNGARTGAPAAGDHWLGLLRVTRIRLVVTPGGTTAFAEGIRRRRSVTERVTLSRAVRLTAAGVPVTLEHLRSAAT